MRKMSKFKLLQSLSDLLHDPACGTLAGFRRCMDLLVGLDEAIPRRDVPWEVRRWLGGYLFPEGPALVGSLVDGLAARPGLFGRYPAARELADGQRRAQAWLTLREGLHALAYRADVLYQIEQATCNRTALDILSDVKARAGQAYADREDKARADALAIPLGFLRRWHLRRGGRPL